MSLRCQQIDLEARMIRLEVNSTKNDDGRNVKMTQEVFELPRECLRGKGPDDLVFTRPDGSPPGDFRKVWHRVCATVGCEGLLLHDMRRSGARNMRRLGISETTAMKIGGWRTSSTFRRYSITDQSDLDEVADKLDAKRAARLHEAETNSQSDKHPDKLAKADFAVKVQKTRIN